MSKTVIIHHLCADNDVTDDVGITDISVIVALDYTTFEVVAAHIDEEALIANLTSQGWAVIHEDDAFTHDGDKWVAVPNPAYRLA
jgi:hypothetical protein